MRIADVIGISDRIRRRCGAHVRAGPGAACACDTGDGPGRPYRPRRAPFGRPQGADCAMSRGRPSSPVRGPRGRPWSRRGSPAGHGRQRHGMNRRGPAPGQGPAVQVCRGGRGRARRGHGGTHAGSPASSQHGRSPAATSANRSRTPTNRPDPLASVPSYRHSRHAEGSPPRQAQALWHEKADCMRVDRTDLDCKDLDCTNLDCMDLDCMNPDNMRFGRSPSSSYHVRPMR